MLIDAQNRFSDDQAVTATAASTNIVDFLALGRDMGSGHPIWAYAVCTTTATSGGSAVVTVSVEVATDAAFTTPIPLVSGPAVAVANVVKGKELLKVRLPPTDDQYRYMRFKYTATTANLTAGTFTGGLVLGVPTYKPYPKGYDNAGDV